jgi:transcription antitermination factor NusG
MTLSIEPVGNNDKTESRLQNTRGIVGIDKFGDTPGTVADHVIELLRAQQKQMLIPSKKARPMFTQGQVVEILRGPFAQQIAVVDRMTKEDRVRVLFSLFNAVTPIDVAGGQSQAHHHHHAGMKKAARGRLFCGRSNVCVSCGRVTISSASTRG